MSYARYLIRANLRALQALRGAPWYRSTPKPPDVPEPVLIPRSVARAVMGDELTALDYPCDRCGAMVREMCITAAGLPASVPCPGRHDKEAGS